MPFHWTNNFTLFPFASRSLTATPLLCLYMHVPPLYIYTPNGYIPTTIPTADRADLTPFYRYLFLPFLRQTFPVVCSFVAFVSLVWCTATVRSRAKPAVRWCSSFGTVVVLEQLPLTGHHVRVSCLLSRALVQNFAWSVTDRPAALSLGEGYKHPVTSQRRRHKLQSEHTCPHPLHYYLIDIYLCWGANIALFNCIWVVAKFIGAVQINGSLHWIKPVRFWCG